MKLKVSFLDIDLSIEVEGDNVVDVIEFIVKCLFWLRDRILEA